MRDTDVFEEVDTHPNSMRVTMLITDSRLDEVIASSIAKGFHVHLFDLTKVEIPIPMPAGDGETYITICRGKTKGGAFG